MKLLKYPVFLLTLIATITVVGCSSRAKLKYLNEPFTTTELKIPLNVTGIEFNDNRTDTSSRALDIPRYTKNGQTDTVHQALLPEHRAILTGEMESYFDGSGKEVEAVIEVLEGEKCFAAGRVAEVEYVKVKLGLTLLDTVHTPYFLKRNGEVAYEIKSLDAKNDFLEQLYQKALKAALYKCCEAISEALKQME